MYSFTSVILIFLLEFTFPTVTSHDFGKQLRSHSPVYKGNNSLCKKQMEIYQNGIENLELWALNMLDSNAKVPSGILMANVDQLGDFEQCLAVRSVGKDIFQGKYCLPEVEITIDSKINQTADFSKLLLMAQSNKQIHGNLRDPKCYLPAFNIFLFGMCMPSGCDEQDAVQIMNENLQSALSKSPYSAEIYLRDGLCRTEKSAPLTSDSILAIALLAVPFVVSLVCWAKEDSLKRNGDSTLSRVFLSMSLGQNWRLLWSRDVKPDPLGCTHGIRAVFLILLYFLHKTGGYAVTLLTNKRVAMQVMDQKWTLALRMFWNYIDGFLFLSAVVTAYHAAGQLKNGHKLNYFKMYLRRYVRFVVPLLVVAYCFTYLAPLINDGPIWMRYFEHLSTNCHGKMWTLATFTSSFLGFPDLCFDTSNHLTTDLILYLLAPFLVTALWKSPMRNFNFCVVLLYFLGLYKYYVIYQNNIAPISTNNFSRNDVMKMGNHLLFPAIMRIPIYFVGVCTGCFLQKIDCKMTLDKRLFWLGNFVASLITIYCLAWHHEVTEPDYVHKVENTMVYALIHPYLWGCALSWFVFICATGQAEKLNKFCSHYVFVMGTRLSLAFNLWHLPVMSYWLSSARSPILFSYFSLINLHEFLVIFVLGLFVTVIYMAPVAQLWTLVNEKRQEAKSSKD